MAVGGVGGAGNAGGNQNNAGGAGSTPQGDRFFLLKNNDGSISYVSKTNAQIYDSQSNPNGWQIPSTALEINSATALQLQAGTITPAAYVASKLAQDLQLSNAGGTITTSSLLSAPSLLNSGVYSGEINSALILSFLRHQKSESDANKALSASAQQITNSQLQQAVIASITAVLQHSQQFNAGNSSAVSQAKTDVGLLSNTLSSDQQNTFNSLVSSAFNILQSQLNAYGQSVLNNQNSPSLKNFGEQRLKTLNNIISNAIFATLEKKINQEILNKFNFEEIGDKTLESDSKGVVIKTPEQQTLELLQSSLKNEENQKLLEQTIVGSAKDLGLEDLTPEDLKTLANVLSKGVLTAASQQSQEFKADKSTGRSATTPESIATSPAPTEAQDDTEPPSNKPVVVEKSAIQSLLSATFKPLQDQLNAYGNSALNNQSSPALKNFGKERLKTLNEALPNLVFSALENNSHQETPNPLNFGKIVENALRGQNINFSANSHEQNTFETLQATLNNEDNQKQLAQVIVSSAKELGLQDLSPEDLNILSNELSKGAFKEFAKSEGLLKGQIASASSLKKDVAALLDLETNVQTGFNSADHPV